MDDGVYVPGNSASDARLNSDVVQAAPVSTRPTQVEHKWRTVIRTAFQVILALAPVAVLAVPTVGLSATVGAGAIIVAAASAITRLMGEPSVNDFIERFLPWLRAE